ncbi:MULTISPECIES: hypothetical protein [unclassified Flavobacterium]|uniref:hypothetical protein n=1 Tax=unclassified Flavobacterium TaxID=196869 RepID=UPI001290A735|nr:MULTISPECIES: hypothetical protein [unclassified Flavobacterium]MQP53154.1 hypothetical protein [Flavobacterium sp. LMO9]MQP63015.1 hypothetical protein [Flavobacterium sp. LMO6]
MKRTALIALLLILFNTILYSQNKLNKYYNTNFENISEKEFNAFLLKGNYHYNGFELEDKFAFILYQPKTKGKLSTEELEKLNKSLLNKGNLNNNNITIIIFYPGKDNCNGMERNSTWNIFDNEYLKQVKKNSFNSFWIYKSDENLKYYHPKKVDWKKDEDQIIENLFFKMHYPCFSSAVIDKDGNYILNLGEFGKQDIREDIQKLTK